MLIWFYTLCMVTVSAECSQPASIPGVGTNQLCTHAAGCPKRAVCVSESLVPSLSSDSLDLLQLSRNIVNCSVICANSDNGIEFWKCVGEELWERDESTPVLKCMPPVPKPCPPFPPVVRGRCQTPVILGYAVNRQLDKCNQVKGCVEDTRLYEKGQLFQDHKGCQARLKVCQLQATTNSVSSEPMPRMKGNSSSLAPIFNVSTLNNISISSVLFKNSSNNTDNTTFAPNNATSPNVLRAIPLAALGALIPTPAPAVPPATKKAQEMVAKSLAGGVTSALPLVQGPWGGAGVDVDITMQELKKLNPTFDFQKTPEFGSFTPIVSDHFARLLYDADNMLVRIVRQ